jgi:gamma-glutamyltranspeptidase
VRHAVAAPRLHEQLVPSNVSFVEEYSWGHTHHEMSDYVLTQLEGRDQSTKAVGFGIGVSQAIYVDYGASTSSINSSGGRVGLGGSSRGVLVGASDSRKDGAPVGHD